MNNMGNPLRRALAVGSTRFAGCALFVAIVLVSTVILWFKHNAPPGVPGKTFPFDFIFYYYPMTEYAIERLSRGELPLWNPYQCCGVPFLATAQVAIFYPGTWLFLVMPMIVAFKVLLFGQVLLAGLFTGLYYRALGVSWYAAGIGGILFVFACVLGQTLWPPQVSTILWMPLLFLCVEKFARTGSLGWWLGFTAAGALQLLGGFPQFCAYTLYLLIPYALVRLTQFLFSGQCGRRQWLNRLASLAAGSALSIGLAGIQVVPTFELSRNSARSGRLAAENIHYLDEVLEQPDIAGTLLNALDPSPRLISFDFSRSSGYVGMGSLFLIALAVVLYRRQPLMWFFLLAAIASFLLSFGYRDWSSPLYRLYESLPTGSMFRTPARLRLITFFSLITLAVMGSEQLYLTFPEWRTHRGRLCSGIAAVCAVAAIIAAAMTLSSRWGSVLAIINMGLLATAWFAQGRARIAGLARALFVILLVADLARATEAHGCFRDLPIQHGQYFSFARPSRLMLGPELYGKLVRMAGLDRLHVHLSIPAKTSRPMERAYTLCDYEPLLPERWRRANDAMEGSPICTMWGIDPSKHKAFYDMASAKYLLTATADLPTSSTSKEAAGRRGGRREALKMDQRATALPRAYLVGRFLVCTPDQALSRVTAGTFDYRTTVLLEKEPGLAQSPQDAPCEAAEIASYGPEQVVISVETKADRILVLTDTYFPGWRAYVDGVETEILRANYLFRAVRVPAGRHQVTFKYKPASFNVGAAMSIASLVLLGGICGATGRLRRERKRA
jgi:hypothetical protein